MFSLNNFGSLCGLVKQVKRTGWLRYLPKEVVESVGDHSSAIAFLALALRGVPQVDYNKCVQMALIHDIAEGLVGDYTPYDTISCEEKHKQQAEACRRIFSPLGQENARYYVGLWEEYEEGATLQAQLVKDLDKLEMMQQAYRYEQAYKVDLKDFYASASKMKTDFGKEHAALLLAERDTLQKHI